MSKGDHKDTVLIFTNRFGEGHRQAAIAIQAAIRQRLPEALPIIIELEKASHPFFGYIAHQLFIGGMRKFPKVYDYFYEKTRRKNTFSALLKEFNRMGLSTLLDTIEAMHPSIIVATDPVSAGMVSVLKKRNILDIPLTTVVTDHAVHSYWINPCTDRYLVGSEEVRKGLAALGVREDRIDVTGIPIHPKFLKTYNRAALMEKYGLQPGVPTLIFTGGGYGLMDGNHSLVHLVDQLPLSLQTVIVCGHNKPLFRRLSEQAKRAQHRFLIIGYTEHMEELMAVADVMVTKAGGLTTAEALAVTLPMIVYPSFGGHEQENLQYLLKSRSALLADNPNQLLEHIVQLLTDARLRQELIHNMKAIRRHLSAFAAAEAIRSELARHAKHRSEPLLQYS